MKETAAESIISQFTEWARGFARSLSPVGAAFGGGGDHQTDSVLWSLERAERLQNRDRALPRRLITVSVVGDFAVIAWALVISFWLRFHTSLNTWGVPRNLHLQDYAGYIGLGTVSLIITLAYLDVYERSATLRFRYVALRILKASIMWLCAFISLAALFRSTPEMSRIFVGFAAVLVPASLLLWRGLFCAMLHRSKALLSLRQRLVFIGWNPAAERLATYFEEAGSAYELVGCLDALSVPLDGRPTVRMLGHVKDIEEIIPRLGIDVVILTDGQCERDESIWLANVCEKEMAQFKVIPSYFQILLSGLHLETMKGVPMLGISRLPLDRLHNVLLKRLVDIIGASVGLLLSAPIIAICGLLVYLESPGPIFYRQCRWGRGGAGFDIYKVRSMKLDAEADGKVGWSTQNDPRRLRIGSFLRKYNLDEVPQFWNVLKGEMSLVGPRPERPELISNFKHEIPHYNARHNAKPGITGWAQVKGLRGDTDLGERIKCDLWYLENWSPLLDIQIMFMTFIGNKNAC